MGAIEALLYDAETYSVMINQIFAFVFVFEASGEARSSINWTCYLYMILSYSTTEVFIAWQRFMLRRAQQDSEGKLFCQPQSPFFPIIMVSPQFFDKGNFHFQTPDTKNFMQSLVPRARKQGS